MTASVDVTNTLTRAESFDGYQGVQLVDESKVRGTAVGATAAGQWVQFAGADLRSGVSGFTARVAKASAGEAAIQVRLDDPASGPVVATVPVHSTGDAYTYATTAARVTGARGLHDVYLVLTGDLRLATFSFTAGRS